MQQVHELTNMTMQSDYVLDFWKEPGLAGRPVEIMVGPRDAEKLIATLNSLDIKWDIVVDDVER